MWLKIETQYASNAADLKQNCLASLYNFKNDPGMDIMSHINEVFGFTDKLREIGKPMQELHIINIILSSLAESYARAKSNWNTIPVAERTVINGKLNTEEKIISCYSKPAQTETTFLAAGMNIPNNQ
jgi:gag-polypeptide of LTR copia-type